MTFSFKHYLNFLDLPNIGTIRISEPFGFDTSTHSVKQDEKRYGRDVIIADENIEFEFTKEEFEKLNTPQQLINGVVINHASHGYDYIIDCIQNEGWQSRIEWIIEKNNVQFVKGTFDAFTCIIGNDSVKFKVIQDTKREQVKRNDDVIINAFSDKDIDGNTITPCVTENILLKAKPVVQVSEWGQKTFNGTSLAGNGFNAIITIPIANNLTSYAIENSYAPYDIFNKQLDQSFNETNSVYYANRFLTARNRLNNITVKIKNFTCSGYTNWGAFRLVVLRRTFDSNGNFVSNNGIYELENIPAGSFLIPLKNYELNIPSMDVGESLIIYAVTFFNTNNLLGFDMTFDYLRCEQVEITATSTAIDSVIKGVRLIDLMKHNSLSVAGLPLEAPIYDVGGAHYNNFAFNGYLLGQIATKPFNNKFKDLMEVLREQNADYQINPNKIQILPYAGFYTNTELIAFEELPDHESTTTFNKRFFVNTIDFNYKNSSRGRETNKANTIDDIHGKSQWKSPNTKADGNLKIELEHTRSAFLIEEQRNRVNETKDTTSLQYDDNLFLVEVVALAPNTQRGFSAPLLMNILPSGHVQILNNNTSGDLGNFSWNLLGFAVGATFFIETGKNIGTFTVFSVTNTLVELTPVTVIVPFTGEAFIKVSYFLTGVQYANRTNEGYSLIDGVQGSDSYSNLSYSIGRNLRNWYSYLATACKYVPSGSIKNTMYEPNGNLVTKLATESVSLADKGNIVVEDIATLKVLNPIIHNITVFADFDQITQLMTDISEVKGFIRVKTNAGKIVKGYPKKLEYEWVTNKLELILEDKYESDFMTITTSGNDIFVNEVGYAQKTGLATFKLNGDYVMLFDSKDIALNNPIRFTNIKINGIDFSNINIFSETLQNILI